MSIDFIKKRAVIITAFAVLSISAFAQSNNYYELKTAAEKGDQKSLITIATMLWNGDGVKEDKKGAEKLLNQAVEKGYPQAFINLVVLTENAGDTVSSQAYLKNGLSKFPGKEQSIIASIISSFNKNGISAEKLLRWIETTKNNGISYPSLFFNEGNAYRELGRIDEAIAAYDQCSIIDPSYPSGYAAKGILYYNMAATHAREIEEEKDELKRQALLDEIKDCLQKSIEPLEKALELEKIEKNRISLEKYLEDIRYKLGETSKVAPVVQVEQKEETSVSQQEKSPGQKTDSSVVESHDSNKEVNIERREIKDNPISTQTPEPQESASAPIKDVKGQNNSEPIKKSIKNKDGLAILIDAGYALKLNDECNYAGVNVTLGYRKGNILIGAGTGLMYAMNTEAAIIADDTALPPKSLNFPVFGHIRYYFPLEAFSPFIGMSAGIRIGGDRVADYALGEIPYKTSGALISPIAGIAFPLSGKSNLYISVGGHIQSRAKVERTEGPTVYFSNPFYSCLELRAGISF